MNVTFFVPLTLRSDQHVRLVRLQQQFVDACNYITPVVRDSRCWNRVALHHLVYRQIRENFPNLGAQMSCNVIYSVSRAARAVYQHPASPWCVKAKTASSLPLIRFREDAPVYFDRHTLSLRGGRLSLFTLDGRMRFQVELAPEDQALFDGNRVREIVLIKTGEGFGLHFLFSEGPNSLDEEMQNESFPDHILISDDSIEFIDAHRLITNKIEDKRGAA